MLRCFNHFLEVDICLGPERFEELLAPKEVSQPFSRPTPLAETKVQHILFGRRDGTSNDVDRRDEGARLCILFPVSERYELDSVSSFMENLADFEDRGCI